MNSQYKLTYIKPQLAAQDGIHSRETTGENEYLSTLLFPETHQAKIPDSTTDASIVKSISGYSNLTGSTNYFILYTPFSTKANAIVGKLTTNPITAQPAIGWTSVLPEDDDIMTNYSRARVVSSSCTAYLSSMPTTSTVVNGKVSAVVLDNCQIPWSTFTPSALTSYNSQHTVNNVDASDGVTSLGFPNGVPSYSKFGAQLESSVNDCLSYGSSVSSTSDTRFSFSTPTNTSVAVINANSAVTFPDYYRGWVEVEFHAAIATTAPAVRTAAQTCVVEAGYVNDAGAITYIAGNLCPLNIEDGATVVNIDFSGKVFCPFPIVAYRLRTINLGLTMVATGAVAQALTYKMTCSGMDNGSTESPQHLISFSSLDTTSTVTVNRVINYEAVPKLALSKEMVGKRFLTETSKDYFYTLSFLTRSGIRDVMTRSAYGRFLEMVFPTVIRREFLSQQYSLGWSDIKNFLTKAYGVIRDTKPIWKPIVSSFNPWAGDVSGAIFSADQGMVNRGDMSYCMDSGTASGWEDVAEEPSSPPPPPPPEPRKFLHFKDAVNSITQVYRAGAVDQKIYEFGTPFPSSFSTLAACAVVSSSLQFDGLLYFVMSSLPIASRNAEEGHGYVQTGDLKISTNLQPSIRNLINRLALAFGSVNGFITAISFDGVNYRMRTVDGVSCGMALTALLLGLPPGPIYLGEMDMESWSFKPVAAEEEKIKGIKRMKPDVPVFAATVFSPFFDYSQFVQTKRIEPDSDGLIRVSNRDQLFALMLAMSVSRKGAVPAKPKVVGREVAVDKESEISQLPVNQTVMNRLQNLMIGTFEDLFTYLRKKKLEPDEMKELVRLEDDDKPLALRGLRFLAQMAARYSKEDSKGSTKKKKKKPAVIPVITVDEDGMF